VLVEIVAIDAPQDGRKDFHDELDWRGKTSEIDLQVLVSLIQIRFSSGLDLLCL
jgi:hypothetical protein